MKKTIVMLSISLMSAWSFEAKCQSSATETRQVGVFSEVNISGGYDKVVFTPGSKEEVTVTAKGIEIDKILTYVKGNALQIETKKGVDGWSKGGEVNIYVTYRALEEINNSGSTDILLKGTLQSKELEVNASGSGDIEGEVEVDVLKLNISGSSDIRLLGKATAQEYNISGSGDVEASKCKGESAHVSISGSGDVQLNVTGAVRSRVSGSGHVRNNN